MRRSSSSLNYEKYDGAPMRISALITCHNRREKTVACLEALYKNSLPTALLTVVLVDDGSTDGTSEAVAEQFPDVIIHRGDGSLFWNKGMHIAHTIAEKLDPDFYLW